MGNSVFESEPMFISKTSDDSFDLSFEPGFGHFVSWSFCIMVTSHLGHISSWSLLNQSLFFLEDQRQNCIQTQFRYKYKYGRVKNDNPQPNVKYKKQKGLTTNQLRYLYFSRKCIITKNGRSGTWFSLLLHKPNLKPVWQT